MAHLHLGLLAYWVVNTVRYQLKKKKINFHWTEIMRIMHTHKLVTTKMQNHLGQTISVRKPSEPIPDVKSIYKSLNYKLKPFSCKKSVVPHSDIFKNEASHFQYFKSG